MILNVRNKSSFVFHIELLWLLCLRILSTRVSAIVIILEVLQPFLFSFAVAAQTALLTVQCELSDCILRDEQEALHFRDEVRLPFALPLSSWPEKLQVYEIQSCG